MSQVSLEEVTQGLVPVPTLSVELGQPGPQPPGEEAEDPGEEVDRGGVSEGDRLKSLGGDVPSGLFKTLLQRLVPLDLGLEVNLPLKLGQILGPIMSSPGVASLDRLELTRLVLGLEVLAVSTLPKELRDLLLLLEDEVLELLSLALE